MVIFTQFYLFLYKYIYKTNKQHEHWYVHKRTPPDCIDLQSGGVCKNPVYLQSFIAICNSVKSSSYFKCVPLNFAGTAYKLSGICCFS